MMVHWCYSCDWHHSDHQPQRVLRCLDTFLANVDTGLNCGCCCSCVDCCYTSFQLKIAMFKGKCLFIYLFFIQWSLVLLVHKFGLPAFKLRNVMKFVEINLLGRCDVITSFGFSYLFHSDWSNSAAS